MHGLIRSYEKEAISPDPKNGAGVEVQHISPVLRYKSKSRGLLFRE